MTRIEVMASENGPNLLMVDGKAIVALCRCGHSHDKPKCDGSHRTAGFKAPRVMLTLVDAASAGGT